MRPDTWKVRRATMEDLHALEELWTSMQFATDALAKRVTEFQVVEDEGGGLIGAVGLEIQQRQGRIHSEAFGDFSHAEYARSHLWKRLEALAQNHRMLRFWTQEQAPFWAHSGLSPAGSAELAELPVQWKELHGRWLTIKLRDDIDAVLAADQEFSRFMQAERARTAGTIRKARALKMLATLAALGVAVAAAIAAFYVLRNSSIFHRG